MEEIKIEQVKVIINDKKYASLTMAARDHGVSLKTVINRINSKLNRWIQWCYEDEASLRTEFKHDYIYPMGGKFYCRYKRTYLGLYETEAQAKLAIEKYKLKEGIK